MTRRFYLVLVALTAAALFLFAASVIPWGSRAQTPPTTYGTLDNFDVINDTSVETHGFEIEIEGISSADVAYTFGAPYQRYGDPTVITTPSGSVIVRYAAVYSNNSWHSTVPGAPGGTPVAVPPYLPTQGHSCWTGGVADAAQYYNSGCDHFGVSLNGTPTRTIYRWLVENPTQPGILVQFGSNTPLPAPAWNVTPPADPGGQPVAEVQISPQSPDPGQMWGEPMWVKVYTTELPNGLNADDLEHMVIDDPDVNIVPNEPAEIEFEWMLLQASSSDPGVRTFGGTEAGEGHEAVSRRFEFYRYTGQLDPDPENLGEALCDNPTDPDQQTAERCGLPNSDGIAGVGALIGAQNAAVNLAGPLGGGGGPVNHPPVANADNATIAEDTVLTLLPAAILGNDSDADGDALQLHSVQNPVGGTVTWDGTNVVFTPDLNFNGTASFEYTMDDGYFVSSATVSIAVTAVNDVPVANAGPDQKPVFTHNVVTLNGSGSLDIDGNALTYTWSFVSEPPHSNSKFINGDNVVNPRFKPKKEGAYVISLFVNDGQVNSEVDTVTIIATKGR